MDTRIYRLSIGGAEEGESIDRSGGEKAARGNPRQRGKI